jgi:hypothetical protein
MFASGGAWAPIHALMVPNGCSTVWRRSRILSGLRSSRSCNRLENGLVPLPEIRRSLPGVTEHSARAYDKPSSSSGAAYCRPSRRLDVSRLQHSAIIALLIKFGGPASSESGYMLPEK